jgi:hypothetical protein
MKRTTRKRTIQVRPIRTPAALPSNEGGAGLSNHPLNWLMSVAAWLNIFHLQDLPEADYQATRARWIAEAEAAGAYSEAVLFRGVHPGDSTRAFNALAKVIAILSFCPGGVHVFDTTFVGLRPGQQPIPPATPIGDAAGWDRALEQVRAELHNTGCTPQEGAR